MIYRDFATYKDCRDGKLKENNEARRMVLPIRKINRICDRSTLDVRPGSNTQSALQLKLDELIRATDGAHTAIMDREELTDQELHAIKHAYADLAEDGRSRIRRGEGDTGTPQIIIECFKSKTT